MAGRFLEETCGRHFSAQEIRQIRQILDSCQGLSRTELASTVCELLDWKRPNGGLKTVECRQFLEALDASGVVRLPQRRKGRPRGSGRRVYEKPAGDEPRVLAGSVKEIQPLHLRRVQTQPERERWYAYVDQYHYLGYRPPFGAHLRYFVEGRPEDHTLLGCLQFSSPSWKMKPRDQWVGWSDEQRRRNLQKVVNQSRFLILPWVRVKNLASSILALAAKVVPGDWEAMYGNRPVLLETLVDVSRYPGICYRAANWIDVGMTTGRGRMDRWHEREGRAPKRIYLYPLHARFRRHLQA